MADMPYPLSDVSPEELKQKVWELVRVLYEEKVAGLDVGDVFRDEAGVITLRLSSASGLEKSNNDLRIKLDGTSLRLSANGLRVGQSAHINTPSGGGTQDAEARTVIVAILDLLVERGLMASS